MRRSGFRWMVSALCLSVPLGCAPDAIQGRTQPKSAHRAIPEQGAVPTTAVSAPDEDRVVERLQTQLALSEAEVRDLRERLSTKAYRRETVRIGADAYARDDWNTGGDAEGGARPMLRLHGPSTSGVTSEADEQAWELAERLPPLPVAEGKPEPVFTAIAPTAPLRSAGREAVDSAVKKYRAALALIRDRQFGSAIRALDRFMIAHASHPYADNALYWKGEALYAQRQYAESVRAFELLLRSYPHSGKRPDSLLKLGMSLERLGQADSAHRQYERLRKRYPDSVAAQRAPRRN